MSDEPGAHVYVLHCRDDSYYVGSARQGLEQRLAEHNSGVYGGYTATRLPVVLILHEHFANITDAIAVERQPKGWPRRKKEALIAGNHAMLRALASRSKRMRDDLTLRDGRSAASSG
jgi:putative endonuclease